MSSGGHSGIQCSITLRAELKVGVLLFQLSAGESAWLIDLTKETGCVVCGHGVFGNAEVFRCEIHFQMVWQKKRVRMCVDKCL